MQLENVSLLRASFQLTYPKSSLGCTTAINVWRAALRCKTLNYYWPRSGVLSIFNQRRSHAVISAIFAFQSLNIDAEMESYFGNICMGIDTHNTNTVL